MTVEVRNGRGTGATPSGDGRVGQGLRGMTERVRALGGELRAGRTPDGGWVVLATIPRRGAAEDEPVDAGMAWPQTTAH